MNTHYKAVLADLIAERDALSQLIDQLTARAGGELSDEPATPLRVVRPRATTDRRKVTPAGSSDREEAVLRQLRRNSGVATGKELRAALRITEDDNKAFQNALTRLKGKGAIARTGQTWSLVGAGSEGSAA